MLADSRYACKYLHNFGHKISFRFAGIPQHLFPAWIRPSFRPEKDAQRLFGEIRRFFGERSGLQASTSADDTLDDGGATIVRSRRRPHVTLIDEAAPQRPQTVEEQRADFISLAKGYGLHLAEAQPAESPTDENKPTSTASAAAVSAAPSTSAVKQPSVTLAANAQPQKRKLLKIVVCERCE